MGSLNFLQDTKHTV